MDSYGKIHPQVLSGYSYMHDYAAQAEWVKVGNVKNTTRQGSLYFTAVGANSPYMDVIDGVNSFNSALSTGWGNLGTVKARLGRLSGITDANFGTLSGYGIYTTSGWFKGTIATGSATAIMTGEGGWQDSVGNWRVGNPAGNYASYIPSTGVLTVSGSITVTSGTLAGLTINSTSLTATAGGNTTTISSGATAFSCGPTASPTVTITQAGVFNLSSVSGGNTTTISAGATAFSCGPTGSPTVTITQAGLGTFSNINITGGSAVATVLTGLGNVPITNGAEAPAVYSTTGSSWSAFTVRYESITYSVSAGNSGTDKYCYWSKAAGTVVSHSAAIPILTNDQFLLWYTAGAAVHKSLFQNVIYADLIQCSTLSALNTSTGTLAIGSGGYIQCGQTAYDTGTGFWFGFDGATPKASYGNSAGNKWTWDGSALTIVGAITGGTLDIGGDDATSFHVDVDGGIWSGAAVANKATAPFRVSNAGALVATSATISGAITGSTIDIGGADTTSFHVDADGNMWSGAATFADGVFKVSNAGVLTLTSGTINIGSGAFIVDASGNVTAKSVNLLAGYLVATALGENTVGLCGEGTGDTTVRLFAGSTYANRATAPFRITQGGTLTATDANISGAITGSTIDIGGADTSSFHVDATGNIWSGAAAYANGVFKVSNAGSVAISSGTLDIGGDDATSFHVDTDGGIWLGASIANKATAPFRVSSAGALVATSATISGAISGSTIDIGGDDATSWHVDVDGNMWSGASIANKATAPFRVSSAGALDVVGASFTGVTSPFDVGANTIVRLNTGTSGQPLIQFYGPSAHLCGSLGGNSTLDIMTLTATQEIDLTAGVIKCSSVPMYNTGGVDYGFWTEYNMGPGGGLDADTLDGSHAAAFAPAAGSSSIVTLGTITTASIAQSHITGCWGSAGPSGKYVSSGTTWTPEQLTGVTFTIAGHSMTLLGLSYS